MQGWRKLYAARDWAQLNYWWRSTKNKKALAAFYEQLCKDVPRVKIKNGTEWGEEHVSPKDAPPLLKGAAEILYWRELETKVLGDPKPDLQNWLELTEHLKQVMTGLMNAEELTEGDASLSRAAHAQAVLSYLEQISFSENAMIQQIDPKGKEQVSREWLRAVIAQTALPAFRAGCEARAAAGKEIERDAVRGQNTIASAHKGGEVKAGQAYQKNKAIIERMQELIDQGHTQTAAARITFNQKLGTTAEANRTAYKRSRRETKKLGQPGH